MYKIWISLVFKGKKKEIYKVAKKEADFEKIYEDKDKLDIPEYYLKRMKDPSIRKEAKKIYNICKYNNIRVLHESDTDYPILLKNTLYNPFLIYVKGEVPKEKSIAVVGSRRSTPYGRKACAYFVKHLAKEGYNIISGMAKGIDYSAHKYALLYGAKTYAILGSGILNCYPKENKPLIKEIVDNQGGVISEYPPYYMAKRWNFPERNRIISGLSRGVLVVEGTKKSGTLITANHALEQNREVFCIPGNIFSQNSLGPNLMINEGANIVSSPYDIIEYYKSSRL